MESAYTLSAKRTRTPVTTLNVAAPIAERVQAAAFWTRSGVQAFVEVALEAALLRAEQRNGTPFPPIPSRLADRRTYRG